MFAAIQHKNTGRNLLTLLCRPAVLFFIAYFFIGIFIYDDYGVSFDEETSRVDNGHVNYNFILNHKKETIVNAKEKYHGPAFEILLVFVEKAFHLTDIRSIHLVRHLCTFLLFFVSVIFFFRIAKQHTARSDIALLSCLFLVLSPRIFAESFYNSKDIALLSAYIIAIYTMINFLKYQSYKSAFLHALASGFLVDIRIVGIIIPVLTVMILIADAALKLFFDRKIFLRPLPFLFYIACLYGFVVLFWPVLWIKPLKYFFEAYQEMSSFPWYGDMLYMGKIVQSWDLPWHYIPVWIMVTVPILYVVYFFAGAASMGRSLFTGPLKFYTHQKGDFIFLVCFFVPIISVILFKSIVYDSWRHLFFVYPPFVMIATKGFTSLEKYFSFHGRSMMRKIMFGSTWVYLFYIVIVMIISHPLQNVYFNTLAGNPKGKFELDYWGLSFRKGLEQILEKDTSSHIRVSGSSAPAKLNVQILPRKMRSRIDYVEPAELSDYYMDNFRNLSKVDINVDGKLWFSEQPLNAVVLSVYKMRNTEQDMEVFYQSQNDFEAPCPNWSARNITAIGNTAHSGTHVSALNNVQAFSEGFTMLTDSLPKRNNIYLRIKCWKYAIDNDLAAALVVDISKPGAESIFYKGRSLDPDFENERYKWLSVKYAVKLPDHIPAGNLLKVYIFNPSKKNLYVDDFSVEVLTAD